jgi:hypothetical protein
MEKLDEGSVNDQEIAGWHWLIPVHQHSPLLRTMRHTFDAGSAVI